MDNLSVGTRVTILTGAHAEIIGMIVDLLQVCEVTVQLRDSRWVHL